MEWYRLHLIFPETMSDSMYRVIAHEESSPRPWCPVFLLLWGLSCGHGELMRLILVTLDYIPFRIHTDLLMPRSLTINHTVNINHLVVYLVDLHIYNNIFIRQDILRAQMFSSRIQARTRPFFGMQKSPRPTGLIFTRQALKLKVMS